ncbi:MAG: hypothetical protein KF795_30835 [Labilithrix sp.]|nr:hypothetical protein [Labilithrix sp.]
MLRLAAYFFVVLLVFGALGSRRAHAEYKDKTLAFGRQMLDIAKGSNQQVTNIVFNGQKIHLGSAVSQDGAADVLGRYEDYCKGNAGQQPTDALFASGEPKGGDKSTPARDQVEIERTGFVRTGDDNEGAVFCFAKGTESKQTIDQAFDAFMLTGEVGAFGDLRYAFASKGADGKTLVITAWTDSQFNLWDMIGDKDQDVPGNDFPEIPRVPNSVRAISAHAEGTGYAINVYKTTEPSARTLAFFDDKMKSTGWVAYDPELTEKTDGTEGRAYLKQGVVVTVATTVEPEGNFVAVGLSGVAPVEASARPN